MNRKLYMEFLDISVNTFYLWKKQKRPIINFLSKYFDDSEIEEFLTTGKLEKLELIKNIQLGIPITITNVGTKAVSTVIS